MMPRKVENNIFSLHICQIFFTCLIIENGISTKFKTSSARQIYQGLVCFNQMGLQAIIRSFMFKPLY